MTKHLGKLLPTAPSVRLDPAVPHPFQDAADLLWTRGYVLSAGYLKDAGERIPFILVRGRFTAAKEAQLFNWTRAADAAAYFRRLGWRAICRFSANDPTAGVLLYGPVPDMGDGIPLGAPPDLSGSGE